MSNKTLFIIFVIFFFILLGIQQYIIRTNPQPDIYEKLDRIEQQILALKKDSLIIRIDTIDNQIIVNEKHYEKVVNTVISQPFYMDSSYVLEYIDRFIKNEGPRYNLYRTRDAEN